MYTSCPAETYYVIDSLQDAFIGFGGNQVRGSVQSGSKWFVMDFQEMLEELRRKAPRLQWYAMTTEFNAQEISILIPSFSPKKLCFKETF